MGLSPAAAQIGPLEPVGDGAGDALLFKNSGLQEREAFIGVADGRGLSLTVPAHSAVQARVQCVVQGHSALPALVARFGHERRVLAPRGIDLSQGAPDLWLRAKGSAGRAQLEALLTQLGGGQARVQVIHLDALPEGFEALRFARHLIISAPDLATLSERQRGALWGAVAAGAVLVVDAGEESVPADLFDDFFNLQMDLPKPSGGQLVKASGGLLRYRPLQLSAGAEVGLPHAAEVAVAFDDQPFLIRQPFGLGELRVLAVGVQQLSSKSVLAQQAFAQPTSGLRQMLSWLSQAPVAAESQTLRFSPWLWGLIALLPLWGLLGRRWPRLGFLGAGLTGAVAFAWAPLPYDTAIHAQRALALPLNSAQALVVGSTDLQVERNGVQVLARDLAPGQALALEDLSPGGGCLLQLGERALWVFSGVPAARHRLSWFAIGALPEAGAPEGCFGTWPAGPLAGGPLFATAQSAQWATAVPEAHSSGTTQLLRWPGAEGAGACAPPPEPRDEP